MSSANGAICLDVLKDAWSPALTLKTALLSVQALLASPEPKDPQDAVVARQFMSEPAAFERQAREWTQAHAVRDVDPWAPQVARLMEMGFPEGAVRRALSDTSGAEGAALEKLVGG